MSILSVDTIQPIGSGSTVTLNAAKIVVGTGITFESNGQAIYAGIITATSFSGSGANLTSLPAQATIANNADNRVITGGSGVNLNGEEKLNWNGQVFGVGTASPNVLGNDNMHTILSVIETSGTRRGQIELGDNQNVDGGGIGDIHFVGHYQNSGHKDMASITANASGSTSGQRGSTLSFSTKTNGTATIAERLRIASNGRVAIGNATNNASPTALLGVIADDGEAADLYVGKFHNLEATAGQSYGVDIRAGSNSSDHGFRVKNRANDATHLIVRGDGKIGIGAASPSHKLHVESSASGVIAAKQTTNNGGFNTFEGKDSSGNVKFYATHNGRVGAADGIIFGTDTAAANILDDYEEGTFTASMQGASNNGSFSGSQQSRYVKIGKQVTCWIMIHGDLSGASGNLEWTGFPFTSENPQEAIGALQFNNMRGGMPSGTNTVFALMHPGLTKVHFRCNADGNNTAYTALSSSTNYGFTYARLLITYTTAS